VRAWRSCGGRRSGSPHHAQGRVAVAPGLGSGIAVGFGERAPLFAVRAGEFALPMLDHDPSRAIQPSRSRDVRKLSTTKSATSLPSLWDLPADLSQRPNAGREREAVTISDAVQLAEEGCGLFVG
jgi:hypothetical protein